MSASRHMSKYSDDPPFNNAAMLPKRTHHTHAHRIYTVLVDFESVFVERKIFLFCVHTNECYVYIAFDVLD